MRRLRLCLPPGVNHHPPALIYPCAMTVSSSLSYCSPTMNERSITLEDYDALPDSTVQALLAPRGNIWPMNIFSAACVRALYFSAVSAVLCNAIGSLVSQLLSFASARVHTAHSSALRPPPRRLRLRRIQFPPRQTCIDIRATRSAYRFFGHMHLKWTIAMNAARTGSGYASDETEEGASDEDELEMVLMECEE
ncbi:hypothetical protein B0H14DRAFT_2843750 [Mycena olivaceomarginata]|nr:hypothetical protein B0H14DRAFT_2843750 [Mycena olivaceomarginata]